MLLIDRGRREQDTNVVSGSLLETFRSVCRSHSEDFAPRTTVVKLALYFTPEPDK